MKYIGLAITALCMAFSMSAQDYFQQEVNTTISVKLDDKRHVLSGYEEIEYINNSPDTLKHIYLHLWPNAYQNNSTAMAIQSEEDGNLDFYFADSIDRGFIDSLKFKVNGNEAHVVYDVDHIDIFALYLQEPLAPGKSLTISTPFRVKIPRGIYSRLGHIGESYQITQWFPKPAVYDKDGWHPMPYLSQGEFYSEYGSYDVKITVPKNYVVGATGDLVDNPEEEKFLNDLAALTLSEIKDKKIPVTNKAGYPDMTFPASSKEYKTLHFHQENVHDFAWFADKRYHVLKGEVALPHSGRKVTTWAMFTNNEADLWKDAIEYLDSSVYYYSLWNGDYPYNHVTAVDGSISAGGGMEYPNITVIGESYNAFGLEQVIVHEVGHNWFYGILGSNERVHAWMDEGLNSFNENRYTEVRYPKMGLDALGLPSKLNDRIGLNQYGPRGMFDLGYLANARRNYDQAIETTSEKFTSMNYGAIVYGKTAIGMDYLLAYLGDELFDQCMHTYFERWKFKHPQPEDLRAVFEEITKKDLSWFFDDFIKSTKKINYSLTKIDTKISGGQKGSVRVTVKNKGGIAAPFSLFGIKDDSIVVAKQWFEGVEDVTTVPFNMSDADKIVIDYEMDIPELDRTNDIIRSKGMFKRMAPISVELLGSLENRNKTPLYYLPLFGWNRYDGIMPGIALYNTTFPEKKLEWLAIPMYSTQENKLIGTGELTYHIYPSQNIRRLEIGAKASVYSMDQDFFHYHQNEFVSINGREKYEGNMLIEIMRPLRTKAKHTISFRNVLTRERGSNEEYGWNQYNVLKYQVSNKQVLKPASVNLQYVHGNPTMATNFSQISLEAKLRINYNIRLRGIDLRVFGGYTLNETNDLTGRYNWHLSGQSGYADYLYDHVMMGRNETIPSVFGQQSLMNHGAFITNTGLGNSSSWIGTVNGKIDLPKGPIKLFFNGGFSPSLNGITGETINNSYYEAGAYITIIKNILEIYAPLAYSENIKSSLEYQGLDFWQRMRFTLHLNELNPFKLKKSMAP